MNKRIFLISLLLLGWGLNFVPCSGESAPSATQTPRTVFLASNLSPDRLVLLTATVAATGNRDVVLVDDSRTRLYLKAFLAAYQPSAVIPVGSFPEGVKSLEGGLDRPDATRRRNRRNRPRKSHLPAHSWRSRWPIITILVPNTR